MKESIFYTTSPYNMYCEKITPDEILFENPIVMITGVAHTGSCYKTTPDGRPGWAYNFAKIGYEVFVTDWPGTGRSGSVPMESLNGQFMVDAYVNLINNIGKKVILIVHSMSGPYAWKLGEILGDKIEKIVAIAPGQMGNIQSAPAIIKRDGDLINVQMPWGILNIDLNRYLPNEESFIKKLIGDGLLFPIDHLEDYKASLQYRHPRLTFERLNIDGSQLKVENFEKLKSVKIMVVTGDHDQDHAQEVDGSIADFLKKNGVDCEFCWLKDKGISGNGHMMMLEKNSDQVAKLIFNYLKE